MHLDHIFYGNVSHDDIKNHIPRLWELFIGKSYFSHACHIFHPHLFPLFTFMLVVFFSVSLWLFMVIVYACEDGDIFLGSWVLSYMLLWCCFSVPLSCMISLHWVCFGCVDGCVRFDLLYIFVLCFFCSGFVSFSFASWL